MHEQPAVSGGTGVAGSEVTWLAPLPGGRGIVAATGDCCFLLYEPQVLRLFLTAACIFLLCQTVAARLLHGCLNAVVRV